MKVAFFHGLESKPVSQKTYALRETFDEVYDPPMDYKDPEMFNKILKHLQENPVDLLIGSSMGGYFAYCLSTILGTRTLLFNPAIHSRPIEPVVTLGDKVSNHLVVLGDKDNIIKPSESIEFFNNVKNVTISREDIAHSIPIEVFKSYIRLY
jgi:uncharacterized protein